MNKIIDYLKKNKWCALAVVVVILWVAYYIYKRREGYRGWGCGIKNTLPQYKAPEYKGGDTTYFQNMNPDAEVETRYHNIINAPKPEGCGSNYMDRFCVQKAYFKAMEDGTTSIPNMICSAQYDPIEQENEYYACLGRTYGNYYPWSQPEIPSN